MEEAQNPSGASHHVTSEPLNIQTDRQTESTTKNNRLLAYRHGGQQTKSQTLLKTKQQNTTSLKN